MTVTVTVKEGWDWLFIFLQDALLKSVSRRPVTVTVTVTATIMGYLFYQRILKPEEYEQLIPRLCCSKVLPGPAYVVSDHCNRMGMAQIACKHYVCSKISLFGIRKTDESKSCQ